MRPDYDFEGFYRRPLPRRTLADRLITAAMVLVAAAWSAVLVCGAILSAN